jgi:replication factor C subunit 3/5
MNNTNAMNYNSHHMNKPLYTGDNDSHEEDNDKSVVLTAKTNKLIPWSEKYRPSSISGVLYHDKIIKSIVNYMANGKLPHLLFYGQPGSGKCLGYDTPIIMFDGTIKMVQNIKQGELLMGDDNTPRTVLSTCTGEDIMYKITQTRGDTYIVNSEHIISLKNTKTRNIIDIPIQDYIAKDYNWKEFHKGFKSSEINCWEEKPVEINPFELGKWLNEDYEPNVDFMGKLQKYNLVHPNPNDNFGDMGEYLGSDLRHVPADYKFNSKKIRIKLIQGFLLKSVIGQMECTFCSIYKHLFDDIVFVIRSLGISVEIKTENGLYWGIVCSKIIDELYNYDNIQDINFTKYESDLMCDITVEELNRDKYYGFELDGNKRFLLGDFTVTHNTSLILAIAKHYYKDDFENMTMVLNASEERGIETVRNRIKQFVISKGLNEDPTVPSFKLIILDEIDAMTDDAQAILRKVIEKYVNNVRFCFICNYLKKINPAIQSRCVIFRFNPIPRDSMYSYIEKVCENEKIFITNNAMELVIKRSNGDMRKLLNILQSLYMYNNMGIELKKIDNDESDNISNQSNNSNNSTISNVNRSLVINENSVSKILSCPTKKNIIDILNCLQTENLNNSYEFVKKIISKNGISLLELINNIYEFCMDYLINENKEWIKYSPTRIVKIIKNLAIINENLTYCNNENIQLISFIAIFYM